jgi:meso-butanediol dehydrogenase/(S,S)-butanediol dehydrogenase/diacetyl reductase
MEELEGVGAIVTGGGRGLGRGLALGLAQRGAAVAACDVDARSAEETARIVREDGGSGIAIEMDVTSELSVAEGAAKAEAELDGVDLLVNNAGVLFVHSVVEMPVEEWRRVLEVNATGTFLVSREVARAWLAAGREGSIVSIASIAGKRGDPEIAHYSASKFAVVGFTQALARELGPHGITVNAICPGLVETEMIEELAKGMGSTVEAFLEDQAIPRPQTPDDIAAAVAFLHRNRSVTGQSLNVDGGTVFD